MKEIKKNILDTLKLDTALRLAKKKSKEGLFGEARILYKDILNNAKNILTEYDISRYTFTAARSFGKRYGLEYLSNNFFQKVKTKQLLLR